MNQDVVQKLKDRKTSKEPSVAEKFRKKALAWRSNSDLLYTSHRIFRGDARLSSAYVEEGPFQLIITSPPYWNLKKYDSDCDGSQLGHMNDKDEFFKSLNKVWKNCYQNLTPGGRLCVIVGDVCRSRKVHGRHLVEPIHADIQIQCQKLGFDPLAPIIWYKRTNAVTEVEGNGSAFYGKPYEPNAIIKNEIEFILLFRKPGSYRSPTQEQRNLSLIDKEDYYVWFKQIWSDISGEPQKIHPAPFPKEVARRLIGMYSFVGDKVLDPFWGVGNTSLAAIEMNRSSVGIEIDQNYIERAQKKVQPTLFASVDFYF